MKNEIKKILNWLNQIIKENKESDVSLNSCVVPFETLYKLQDCITNLQQERDKFKSRNEKAIEYIKQHTEQRIYQEPYNIDGFPDRVEYFIEGKWNLLDILQGEDKDVNITN